jgi:predicted dehydrogenase
MNIGIIGIGNSGTAHLTAYKDLKNGRVTSVYDIDKDKMEKAKKIIPGCRVCSSLEDFLGSDIKVVDLCVPAYENHKLIKEIAEKGKHILCDVPLSDTLDGAGEIEGIIKKSGIRFTASRISDYSSNYKVFKDIIDRGKIGEPGFLRASLGGGYPESYRGWLDDDKTGGGVIVNLGVNLFFYAARLFGKAERVFARRSKYIEGENKKDYALIIIRFENDNIAHVELSWAYPDGSPYILKLDAFGTNGQLWYDDSMRRPMRIYDSRQNEKQYSLYRTDNPTAGNPYLLQMEDFIDSIKNDDTDRQGLEDDIYALDIALACLKSSRENKVVKL